MKLVSGIMRGAIGGSVRAFGESHEVVSRHCTRWLANISKVKEISGNGGARGRFGYGSTRTSKAEN